MKDMNRIIKSLVDILKLEVITTAGKVNLFSIIVLVLFVLAYTANDAICYVISAVRDALKTWILKTNISDPYQSISVFKLLIPILVLIFFCLLFLFINEKAKRQINDKRRRRRK